VTESVTPRINQAVDARRTRQSSLVQENGFTKEAHVTFRNPPLIRGYMPELDALRGLAILLVLFFHGIAPPLRAELSGAGKFIFELSQFGWVGVNLFFVLSGFLITGILIDTRNRPDYFRRFYIRRALRILPAFYACLVILLLGGFISWRFLLVSAVFLANTAPLLGVPLQYGPLWSLAVEEHFYMLWPALIRRLSFRSLILGLTLVLVLTPALRAFDFQLAGRPAYFVALYTWLNLDGLALGSLLAIFLRRPEVQRTQLSRIASMALIGGVITFVLMPQCGWVAAAFSMTACNIASAGLLASMLVVGTSRWNFLVDRPFLKFLGFISYGLYLIHVLAFRLAEIIFSRPLQALAAGGRPVLAMLLHFAAGSVMAVSVAYLSRRSLEERFLRLGFGSRPQRVATSTLTEHKLELSV
jgi:peptidoglycan/LPS O-acetylase OafA/YrhL